MSDSEHTLPVKRAEVNLLQNPSFEYTDAAGVFAHWVTGGADTVVDRVASTLRPSTSAGRLVFGQSTASFFQSVTVPYGGGNLEVEAWARCDTPACARILAYGAGAHTASPFHPGDGEWHLLRVTVERHVDAFKLDVYLQLVTPAQADFDDCRLTVASTELEKRWETLAPLIVSPRHQRPLRVGASGRALIDGDEFPAYRDVPILLQNAGAMPPVDSLRCVFSSHRVGWWEWLFSACEIPVSCHPVLDVGCGAGCSSAVIHHAGAVRVLGVNPEVPDLDHFHGAHAQTSGVSMLVDDVVRWPFAPASFACVNLQSLEPPVASGLERVASSLVSDGVVRVLLDDAEVERRGGWMGVLQLLDGGPLRVFKLARLDGWRGFLLCHRSAFASMRERLGKTCARMRRGALQGFLDARTRSLADVETNALRNFFLAAVDYCGDVALAHWNARDRRVGLVGRGLLGYYVWRIMSEWFMEFPVDGVIVNVNSGPSSLNVLTEAQARELWGERVLRVHVDMHHYAESARGVPMGIARPCDLYFIAPKTPQVAASDAAFHLLDGELDRVGGTALAEGYLCGLLRLIGGASPMASDVEFDQRFFATFPSGYAGVL